MIRRMAGLNCDERAAAGCRHFVVRDQLAFHDSTVVCRFNHTRDEMDWLIGWSWPQEFDCVICGDGAGRMIQAEAFHQMVSSRPVTMTVKHGTCDATTQHSRKRFLIRFRLPIGDNFIAVGKAAHVQSFFICRATTKTREIWRVGFLDAFFVHGLNVGAGLVPARSLLATMRAGTSPAP